MKPLFYFLFLVFFISAASAAGFSPSSLTFNLKQNEEQCQIVTLTEVTDDIDVLNVWAENKDVEWKINNFQTDATSLNLDLTYSVEDNDNGKIVEVCLKGSQQGEYHGAIIFKQQQQGNSVVQLAVWIKAIIENQQPNSQSNSGNSNSGSSTPTTQNQQTQPTQNNIQELSAPNTQSQVQEAQQNTPAITDNTIIKEENGLKMIYIIIPAMFILVFYIVIKVYSKIQYRRRYLGYT